MPLDEAMEQKQATETLSYKQYVRSSEKVLKRLRQTLPQYDFGAYQPYICNMEALEKLRGIEEWSVFTAMRKGPKLEGEMRSIEAKLNAPVSEDERTSSMLSDDEYRERQVEKNDKKLEQVRHMPKIEVPEHVLYAFLCYYQFQLLINVKPNYTDGLRAAKDAVSKLIDVDKDIRIGNVIAEENADILKKRIQAYLGVSQNQELVKTLLEESAGQIFEEDEILSFETLYANVKTLLLEPDISAKFVQSMQRRFDQLREQKAQNESVTQMFKRFEDGFGDIVTAYDGLIKAKTVLQSLQPHEDDEVHFSELLKDKKDAFDYVVKDDDKPYTQTFWSEQWAEKSADQVLSPRPAEKKAVSLLSQTFNGVKQKTTQAVSAFNDMSRGQKVFAASGAIIGGGVALAAASWIGATGLVASTASTLIGVEAGRRSGKTISKTAGLRSNSKIYKQRLIALARASFKKDAKIVGIAADDLEMLSIEKLTVLKEKAALIKSLFKLDQGLSNYLEQHTEISGNAIFASLRKWFNTQLPGALGAKVKLQVEVEKLKATLLDIRSELESSNVDSSLETIKQDVSIALFVGKTAAVGIGAKVHRSLFFSSNSAAAAARVFDSTVDLDEFQMETPQLSPAAAA